MKKDKFTRKIYLGTVPIDQLPKKIKYPSCLVINNQTSYKPGEHWLAIYFDKMKRAEFFDSFGNNPIYYNLKSFLEKNAKSFQFNKRILQSNSSSHCGYYCILYLLFRARGYTLKNILKYFKTPEKNDLLIEKLIKKYF